MVLGQNISYFFVTKQNSIISLVIFPLYLANQIDVCHIEIHLFISTSVPKIRVKPFIYTTHTCLSCPIITPFLDWKETEQTNNGNYALYMKGMGIRCGPQRGWRDPGSFPEEG